MEWVIGFFLVHIGVAMLIMFTSDVGEVQSNNEQ